MAAPEDAPELRDDEHDADVRRRGDDLVRRMLNTPPMPQEQLKLGKRKPDKQVELSSAKRKKGGPRNESRPNLKEEGAR